MLDIIKSKSSSSPVLPQKGISHWGKSKCLLSVVKEGSQRSNTLPVLGVELGGVGWGLGFAQCTDNVDCVRETDGGTQSRECSITSQRACHPIPSHSLTTERPLSTG